VREEQRVKPRAIVFDIFGDYLRYRGGEARLRDLTALLELFGVSDGTTRVVMARMRKEGWFDTRPGRDGREVVYALNDRSWALLDEGRERIFARPEPAWDGWWHLVIYYVPESARGLRDRLRKELSWLGFGPLAASTWASPHDRLGRVEDKFRDEATVRLDLLRSRSKGLPYDRDMAERCWDLTGLNADYAAFLDRYRAEMPRFASGRMTTGEALVARTQLIHDYRRFPFRDPDLPEALLPARWLGAQAREVFVEARERLREAAERAVDEASGPVATMENSNSLS
jgi:phenylacetic acid degradation operon negative regulatory protein